MIRTLACALVVVGLSVPAVRGAAPGDLYEAAVPVETQTPKERTEAVQRALSTVLVRVTGRREAAADPALSSLIKAAERYVQQYGYTTDNTLRVGFDGVALRNALLDAGQPVWGTERPVTLLWLAIDNGSGRRSMVAADDESDVVELLESIASQRGIPLVLPLLDTEDLARVSFSDVWGGFGEEILAASTRYGADAVLVGRAGRSVDGRLTVRWTLHFRGQSEEWQGTLEDGIQRSADRFAEVFAPAGERTLRALRVEVTGIEDLNGYGTVSRFLENLTFVQSVDVEEVAADRVAFRVALRGSPDTLDRAVSLSRILEPVAGENTSPSGADLRYRLQP
ncbi:DUF2066 domain-containing protein [soil metagenome]